METAQPTHPSRLFKYVTAERAIGILQDKTIRFTQPALLNDPFEFCPTLNLAVLKDYYFQLPDVKETLEATGDRENTLKGFHDFCRGIAYSTAENEKTIGMLSLSERCDIPLMWSHYAENHRGVVIGLDVTKGLFRPQQSPRGPEDVSLFEPVRYCKKRAEIPSPPNDRFGYMFVKDSRWEYEKEWRLLRGLKQLREVKELVYVAELPVEAVTCVIYGLFTPQAAISSISDIIHKEYSNVPTYAMLLNADDFDLDLDTSIGRVLCDEGIAFEEIDSPGSKDLYRYTSKGELFKAMEIIDKNIAFSSSKEELGF